MSDSGATATLRDTER